ncbi:MAG: YSC84-related protein [Pseudomonadota bacterium]
MAHPTRRAVLVGAAAAGLAACDNSVGSGGAANIDQQVGQTLSFMYNNIPETKALSETASGLLVMPAITEAGLFVGGSYGEGALLINDLTVDYYSATQASVGLQVGAQRYAHTLFFMTPEALRDFRTSPGWSGGVDAEFVVSDTGGSFGTNTEISGKSVIAVFFAQSGLRVGATVAGTKYTRVLR